MTIKGNEIKLNKEQTKHLKSLQWLYMGTRASGRSTLLAYVLIETVLKTGISQRIIDHHPSVHTDRYLQDTIGRIIEAYKLPLKINRMRMLLERK